MVAHLPQSDSMVGHDLFVKLGCDMLSGVPLEVDALCATLPYPPKQVRQCLAQMQRAGLIVQQAEPDRPGVIRLIPTTRFVDALKSFDREFERTFVLRQSQRDNRLHVGSDDPGLRRLMESIYDHFHDLGWLYTDTSASICCLMAHLVGRAAASYGYRSEIKSGYVEVLQPSGHRYLLGAEGSSTPGQIDGHAFCVIDERLVADFGLGNLRRKHRGEFYWALACDLRRDGPRLGGMSLPNGSTVAWKDDWQSLDTEAEIAKCQPVADRMFQHYLAAFA